MPNVRSESAVAAQAYTTPRHSVFSDSRDKGAGLPLERCAGGLEAGIVGEGRLFATAKSCRQIEIARGANISKIYFGTALEQPHDVGVALVARPLARSPTLVVHAVGTRSRVEAQLHAFHAAALVASQ